MSDYKVFFSGTPNCGLGNILFKLANAIYYAEKYNYQIILDKNSPELYVGTSINEDREKIKIKDNTIFSYENTIFNKLIYDDIETYNNNSMVVFNNYTSKILTEQEMKEKNICIDGYCQNYNLFFEYREKIPKYLNLHNETTIVEMIEKYNIDVTKKNIMIGMRLCKDFSHMKKITTQSYKDALTTVLQTFTTTNTKEEDFNLIVISDTKNGVYDKLDFEIKGNIICIEEDDITQFQIGLLCDYFILCESTFHYWIALIKESMCLANHVEPPFIVCFKDTDLTTRPIALPNWTFI